MAICEMDRELGAGGAGEKESASDIAKEHRGNLARWLWLNAPV